MIRNDYLMRSIQQLAGVFAKMIAKKKELAPEEIRLELEERLSEFMKTRRALLYSQDKEAADTYDPRVATEVGKLWSLNAEMAHAMGDAMAAKLSLDWALRALIRGLTPAETPWSLAAEARLFEFLRTDVCAAVADRDDVANAYRELFEYAAATRHLENAEDALFAGIDLGEPTLEAAGTAYFSTLLEEVDAEELERCGLTRPEVEAILDELAG